jgi:hypothetical protein
MTRAVEVLKYLRRTVPKIIPRSSLDALETVPPAVLSSLHIASDWEHVTQDAKLKDWLHTHDPRAPGNGYQPAFSRDIGLCPGNVCSCQST